MIDLSPEQLAEVKGILRQRVPSGKVYAFGSRVQGGAQPYSDLDLAVKCQAKLSLRELGSLKDAFSASNLPMSVDVVDWHAISEDFKRVLEGSSEAVEF